MKKETRVYRVTITGGHERTIWARTLPQAKKDAAAKYGSEEIWSVEFMRVDERGIRA